MKDEVVFGEWLRLNNYFPLESSGRPVWGAIGIKKRYSTKDLFLKFKRRENNDNRGVIQKMLERR